ncbi:uncharacterized protein [Dermacentor andersoni]|uniref:uncharacterized protein n=1 Tax=Dermacentor andersoni TaxID=34620 RepID=UPI0024179D5F|nr:uncharacterized protein LOC126528149 [Dermacentor andersoni]
MRRGQSPVQLPPCPRRRPPPVQPPLSPWRRSPAPKDTSCEASCARYSCFVLLAVLVATTTLLATPALLLTRLDPWRRDHFTLDEDLRSSRDHSVHPCDDFYRHVCSNWDANSRRRSPPLSKYKAIFDSHVVKRHLLRSLPKHSHRARDKATALLIKCFSRGGRQGSWTIQKFLLDVGLPWPHKSPASRPELLGTLVKSSLHFGIHIFWAFFVGRHPSRPNQNVIYTTLDERCIDWIGNFERLRDYVKHRDYLRRCAEILGGTGQSYSRMIEAVTVAHTDIAQLVFRFWDPQATPAFLELGDAELRRALNGHLADDSQLWPEDKIVNLQPELFAQLNATHFSHDNFTENFKLFLGAYAVWLLSPYASRYLTTCMLEDMGLAAYERSYWHHKCMLTLEETLPLAKWKLEQDASVDKVYTSKMLHLAKRSLNAFNALYSDALENYIADAMAGVVLNARNMTLTWHMLDRTYAYVPFDTRAGLFDLYIRICTAGMSILKKSLRQPRQTALHAPGIASYGLYRILVAREVMVPSYMRALPLFDARHPLPVLVALIGTHILKQMVTLERFILFYDENFVRQNLPIFSQFGMLFSDTERYQVTVNNSGYIDDHYPHEGREIVVAGWANRLASSIPRLPEARAIAKATSAANSRDGRRRSFGGVPEDQLYFLVTCFTHCGAAGRALQLQKVICNAVLPAVAAFRQAFECRPHHLLVTDFTWPEPPNETSSASV